MKELYTLECTGKFFQKEAAESLCLLESLMAFLSVWEKGEGHHLALGNTQASFFCYFENKTRNKIIKPEIKYFVKYSPVVSP